jgi:hypothetical protein
MVIAVFTRRTRIRRWTVLILSGLAVAALTGGGCGVFESGGGAPNPPPPTSTETPTSTASPETASPTGSVTTQSTPTGSPTTSGTPTGTVAPVTCTSVTPVRVEKVTAEPRRTIETVTLVSDGRNLTPGTQEQSDFLTPVLTAPDGTTITDEATSTKIAGLIASSSARQRVLLERPEPPDTGVDVSRRPYNTPGTYVAYSSASVLNTDVIVNCSGQDQRWLFRAEADLTSGVVNCAVEPPKSNAVARQVYAGNC